ncbi:uncharacterized protein LOC130567960 [Triplophysa rosa]|uniref:uncharacterized protein LOC130567960 n=1 Tax=Triplophysa rosa TaxID=992332 RepID=UPI002545FF6D|nr:uncharacterized protein LOC130567960 [Triplophysa rosa]
MVLPHLVMFFLVLWQSHDKAFGYVWRETYYCPFDNNMRSLQCLVIGPAPLVSCIASLPCLMFPTCPRLLPFVCLPYKMPSCFISASSHHYSHGQETCQRFWPWMPGFRRVRESGVQPTSICNKQYRGTKGTLMLVDGITPSTIQGIEFGSPPGIYASISRTNKPNGSVTNWCKPIQQKNKNHTGLNDNRMPFQDKPREGIQNRKEHLKKSKGGHSKGSFTVQQNCRL